MFRLSDFLQIKILITLDTQPLLQSGRGKTSCEHIQPQDTGYADNSI